MHYFEKVLVYLGIVSALAILLLFVWYIALPLFLLLILFGIVKGFFARSRSFPASKKGTIRQKGQSIGTVGSTGTVKKPQLHFEIRYKTKVVNPKNYLP